MKPAESVISAIYAEQVGTVFRQMPIALAANFVNAALTAIVLAPLATRPIPLPLFVATTLATIGRLILWLRYRRVAVRPEAAHRWSRLATGGALLSGLCWGIGGAVMFPVIPMPGRIFLTIVIGGMCAGGVVTNASHLPTLLVFLFSASLPMAVPFFCRRLNRRYRARRNDRHIRGSAGAGRKAPQPHVRGSNAAALRIERDQSSLAGRGG
jgi:hypothetical protein